MRSRLLIRYFLALSFPALLLVGCSAESGLDELIPQPASHALGIDAGAGSESVWTSAGTMNRPRKAHSATRLPSGRVLVTGGYGASSFSGLPDAEEYDPETNTWTAVGPMLTRRLHHTAILLPYGRVLVAGGYRGSSMGPETYPTATVEVYHPTSRTFTPVAPMSFPRGYPTATLLTDGRVLVAGGDDGTIALATAEIYDPATNTWTAVGLMKTARYTHTAALLLDGRVLMAGGYDGTSVLDTAEIYEPANQSFISASSMGVPRHRNDVTLLLDGRVLMPGPPDNIYDPVVNQWSPTANMGVANGPPILLPSGRVLAAGGFGNGYPDPLKSADVYDPDTNGWGSIGSMTAGRTQHTATLLNDGRVLVAGGGLVSTTSALDSAELFRSKLEGEACDEPGECESGACAEGVCACDEPGECESDACADGVCACASVEDCAPGLVCDLSQRCAPPPPHSDGGCDIVSRPPAGGVPGWGVGVLFLVAGARVSRRRASSRHAAR